MSNTDQSRTQIKDNPSRHFFVSKASKISSAIYIVTDLLDIREPLRWKLRNNVLDIVSTTSHLFNTLSSFRLAHLNDIRRLVEEILFLTETASRVQLISLMNKEVLFREIRSFIETLERHVADHSSADDQSIADVLKTNIEPPSAGQHLLPALRIHKGHSKGQENRGFENGNKIVVKIGKPHIQTSPAATSSLQQKNGNTSNERREKILALLADKGSVTVKDIATRIPGYSEKTIQRDLTDLLALGRIKKTGERRWTMYFL